MIGTLEALEKAISDKRLGHSILLEGKNEKLLVDTAHSLASKILGTKNLQSHPDYFSLRPAGRSRFIRIGKKDDRNKGSWPENTMRRLIDDLNKTSNLGGPKVAIIYDAERMNKESANAFLKTLEEPPKNTILFLITQRSYDLLNTIRSRCLRYRIPSNPVLRESEIWDSWKKSYWNWMSSLVEGYDKNKLCDLFFGFYGMVLKLQKTIENYRERILEEEKEDIIKLLSDEEKTAIEIGIERSVREQLFREIADLTSQFVKESASLNNGHYMIHALNSVIEALSKSLNLLQLNFNAGSAIELYFLKSLRIWSTANKESA